MCWCTPEIRTPWCGKKDCTPHHRTKRMIEAGEFIEPKRIPADHKVKAVVPDGMDPTMLRDIMQDYANFLASKGCTFFQADVNDNNTILIMSGWLQQPGLPDLPYVDRSELEPPKVTKLSVVERN